MGAEGPTGPAGPAGDPGANGVCPSSCTGGGPSSCPSEGTSIVPDCSAADAIVRSSCEAHLQDGCSTSGYYCVQPDSEVFAVYCDQTTEGGGWALIANHQDNAQKRFADVVGNNTNNQGEMSTDGHWQQIRNAMQTGMMFVDENNKVSRLSKEKLEGANCVTPWDRDTLWVRLIMACVSLDAFQLNFSTPLLFSPDRYGGICSVAIRGCWLQYSRA